MYSGWLHKKTPENRRIDAFKKNFWVGSGFSNFFRLPDTTEFIFLLGSLKSIISALTYVFWLLIQENTQKSAYRCPQKKNFWVGFWFSNFFRLPETTEFIFLLGPLKSIMSALTYVFWLVTQENTRKSAYRSPQKKNLGRFRVLEFFSTTWNDRIYFSSRVLKKFYISISLWILVGYAKKSRKLAYRCPQKKIYASVSGSRIFFDYLKRPNLSFF